MNILYIDCRMGATAAKILGALIDVMESPDVFVHNFNKIGMDGIRMERFPEALNGVKGSKIKFTRYHTNAADEYADELDDEVFIHAKAQKGRTLKEIVKIIRNLDIPATVSDRAIRIYNNIAKTDAKVNHKDVDTMVMRRTGSRDVIGSIVGVCMAIEELSPEKIIFSAIAVGDGYTYTPRGKLPVPIPEVQRLLKDIPYTAGTENEDICTLCGAAVIAELCEENGKMPEMTVTATGAGFGRRSFKSGVNCVRIYSGKITQTLAKDGYIELTAHIFGNIEAVLGSVSGYLEEQGAVSVYASDVYTMMCDKSFKLTVTVPTDKADAAAMYILENTNTASVVRTPVKAYLTE